MFDKLRVPGEFVKSSLLLLGNGSVAAKGWFARVRILDVSDASCLNHIEAPDEAYDFIVSSHVLQNVVDHRIALSELTRVLGRTGFMYVSYPSPLSRERSEENRRDGWSSRQLRVIGMDFETEFKEITPAIAIRIKSSDPVTGDMQISYLFTKNPDWIIRIARSSLDASLVEFC